MSTIGVWHLVIKDGEPRAVAVPQALSIRVTNIALGDEIADSNGRTVVKLSFEKLIGNDDEDDEDEQEDDDGVDDEDKPLPIATTVLAALTPGKIEQASLDVTLESATIYEFKTTGKNTVYLTGNYFVSEPMSDGEDYSDLDDEEEGHLLEDVSSDVEMPLDHLAGILGSDDEGRFEEVDDEEPSKTTKRPRESDVTEEVEVSKSEKKKKLKNKDGKAVIIEETTVETKVEKKDKKKKEKKKSEDGEKETKSVEKKTLAGGIVVEDAKVGTGVQAKKGSTVRMRYIGKLPNGKVFDQNTKGKPFTFRLGQGTVIKGWDEGIVGMQTGGERKLTIPAAMGYGKKAQGDIPANSTLIFDVKCLEVK
ncbi:hypothetical protein CPB83DRAFT_852686 [Crepidotus variabilis]|uniref:FK506-binding protein n=1 Tax=Crepidotus variabilis TaxID=179855 RepID=A0A9P6EIS4_9AGAR|nr:hypothetical protein CPB83DRAFT_852686 [Crepidotus variabilis]